MTDLKVDNVGVYITSEKSEADPSKKLPKGQKHSYEKFGFNEPKEVLKYIKDNIEKEDFFIIYTYEMFSGVQVMKLLSYGDSGDLASLK